MYIVRKKRFLDDISFFCSIQNIQTYCLSFSCAENHFIFHREFVVLQDFHINTGYIPVQPFISNGRGGLWSLFSRVALLSHRIYCPFPHYIQFSFPYQGDKDVETMHISSPLTSGSSSPISGGFYLKYYVFHFKYEDDDVRTK